MEVFLNNWLNKNITYILAYDEESTDVPDENLPEDPSKEKQSELPNAIIVGVIVGKLEIIYTAY